MKKCLIIVIVAFFCSTLWAAFTDNENGTVTDSSTALVWIKGAGPRKNWADAGTYCSDLDFGGYGAWRLPTLAELLAIVEEESDPEIDPVFDIKRGGFSYWTSDETTQSGYTITDRAYAVSFIDGSSFHAPKRSHYRVRCVQAALAVTWQGGPVTWQGSEVSW